MVKGICRGRSMLLLWGKKPSSYGMTTTRRMRQAGRKNWRMTLNLPAGFQVESLPAPRNENVSFGQYIVSYDSQPGAVHCVRRMVMNGMMFQVEYYPILRAFYNSVRSGDGQQAVLNTAVAAQ